MSQLTIGLLSGAWAHETEAAALAYFQSLARVLETAGHTVVLLTYSGASLREYAKDVHGACKDCDIILCYSTGAIVGNLIVGNDSSLKEKEWYGISPILKTGLSWRGFFWSVSQVPWSFTRAFLPWWRGVRVGVGGIMRLFGNAVDDRRAYALVDKLHPEPLRVCLELSFPRLFGLHRHMGDIHWTHLVVPQDDGFVKPWEVGNVSFDRVDIPPGGHGWIFLLRSANSIRYAIASSRRDEQSV